MNEQEIFNTALWAIVRQGKPAYDRHHGCVYYTREGNRCAIGWLLSEEEARNFPAGTVNGLFTQDALPPSLVPHLPLLIEIQRAHDGNSGSRTFIPDFLNDMQVVANEFRLQGIYG